MDDNNNFWLYDEKYGSNGFFPFNTMRNGEDTHFGMTVDFNFYMPQGGMIDGQPMTFNFSGDDDVWVFIDGKLALDIGGIHGAMIGDINFATGVATVNQVMGGSEGSWDDGKPATVKLWELFGYESLEAWQKDWSYEPHELKFFYLERGAGESNCKIDFNMPTVSANAITVAKSLEDSEGNKLSEQELAKMSKEEKTFTMQLVLDGVASNYNYSVHNYTIGNVTKALNPDGTFTIQAGQVASINKIDSSITGYRINEILEASNYNVYFGDSETELKESNGKFVAQSPHYTIDDDEQTLNYVTVHNRKPSASATIYKDIVFTDDSESYIDSVLDGVSFTVYDSNNTAVAENVTLKKEGNAFAQKGGKYYAEVTGLVPGETYTVVENTTFTSSYYDLTVTAEPSVTNEKTKGLLERVTTEGPNEVTFTNTYSPSDATVTITKTIVGLDNDNLEALKDQIVFKLTNKNDLQKVYQVELSQGKSNEDGTYTVEIDHVVPGIYLVTEEKQQVTGYDVATEFSVEEITVVAGGTYAVNVENEYTLDHNNLTITKQVAGATAQDIALKTFTFTITAQDDVDADKLTGQFNVRGGSATTVSFDGKVATVTVTGAGNVIVEDLPVGDYVVAETGTPEDLENYYYAGNDGPKTARVQPNSQGTASITNSYKSYKSLTITKVVTGSMGSSDDWFDFTVSGNNNAEYTVSDNQKPVTAGTNFRLNNGSTITLNKLKPGNTVIISEATSNGYTAKGITIDSSELNDDDLKDKTQTSVTITIPEGDNTDLGTVIFTNEREAVAPTGLESNHTAPYTIMVTVAGIAGLALIGGMVVRRRRRRME